MEYRELALPGVFLLIPKVFGDERGFFMETWRESAFQDRVDTSVRFVQDNHSRSVRGVLRGLHYQIRHPQGKLVRCVRGEIFDVAVDLRRNSPTFGQWVAEVLSRENRRSMWIPPGFAHGFYVLSEVAEFVYRCTDYYAPEHERALRWDDPDLAIDWPVAGPPVLSARDAAAPLLRDAEVYEGHFRG
jgi:dTDP-4-dehydrorhamnose 3,5-epimerase